LALVKSWKEKGEGGERGSVRTSESLSGINFKVNIGASSKRKKGEDEKRCQFYALALQGIGLVLNI